MASESTACNHDPLPVLTTGDVVLDRQIYVGDRILPSQVGKVSPFIADTVGGAFQLHRLIEASVGSAEAVFGLDIVTPAALQLGMAVHTLWKPCPGGLRREHDDAASDQKPQDVWRVEKALGYSLVSEKPFDLKKSAAADRPCSVLVIDDAGLGFRTHHGRQAWPQRTGSDRVLQAEWIVLKMSNPLAQGDLWRSLIAGPPDAGAVREKLIVVISADELRHAGAAISNGFSWERSLAELCRELEGHPELHALLALPRHLVVNFGCAAAVWFGCPDGHLEGAASAAAARRLRLVYDPSLAESDWESCLMDGDPKNEHKVYGHLNVFTAALAVGLHSSVRSARPDPSPLDLSPFVQRGLTAVRQLRRLGHGVVSAAKPEFPYRAIASMISPVATQEQKDASRLLAPRGYQVVTMPRIRVCMNAWSLAALAENPPDRQTLPLFGLAHRVALFGDPALEHIPHASFGKLLSVDRDEIETLRSLSRMIIAYEKKKTQKKPLCLAAFGPPGAGKSFGIRQIAQQALGEKVPILEFNLSQYNDSSELIGAFHQVRDKVLQGMTPVVFWDEFDSHAYLWLQYLLAPMQDGSFQENGHTHTLGKCVFVFAGATSWDFEHFGPAPMPAEADKDAWAALEVRYDGANQAIRKAEQEANDIFRRKKGPDFISRLDGYIDVLGPNQRLIYDWSKRLWAIPDAMDITYPVRRAILLRSFLGLKKGKDQLSIDRDLLRAFLQTPRYRHGARSLEKIARPLALEHTPFRRAHLPPPQVLVQHLDTCDAFEGIYLGGRDFLSDDNVRRVAAAIDENYERHADRVLARKARDEGGTHTGRKERSSDEFIAAFDLRITSPNQWEQWLAATNIAAARRLPDILAMVGLRLEPKPASAGERVAVERHLSAHLGILAKEEHDLWMQFHRANGWRQASQEQLKMLNEMKLRDKVAYKKEIKRLKVEERIHTLLVPFDRLPEEEKSKDHDAIMNYPDTVALVGWGIAFIPCAT